MTFEWDEAKNIENIVKHNVSFEEAQEAFYDENAIINEDDEHSIFEKRYFCVGKTKKGILTVRFTYRNNNIRIIGAGYWRKQKNIMKRKIIYTDAPPEIEEAFARSKRIPNFIDIDSLVRKDGTRPSFVEQKPQIARRNGLKKVAAVF